jgi:hypothetical protein
MAKRDLIDMEFFSDISLPALPKDGAKAYVEELLSLAYQDFLFWFDLALIAPSSWRDRNETERCD